MWQNFLAKDFRCFSSVLLQPLERVNLIAGLNNSGKTAPLEAMHIHSFAGNCALPFQIQAQRGVKEPFYLEEVANSLFYHRQAAQGFELTSQDDKGVTRDQQVWLVDASTARERFPKADKMLQNAFIDREIEPHFPRIVMKSETQGEDQWAIGVPLGTGGPP